MTTNSTSVKTAAGLVRASQKAYTKKWSFTALFMAMLFIWTGVLGSLDLLPEAKEETADARTSSAVMPLVAKAAPELPTKIEIPTIGMSETVSNPSTTNVQLLDQALLTGPARYPTSSKLGEAGNVILFGHSSYLPIVRNKAFKAFDGIQDLKAGDRIYVTGEGHTYTYAVETVQKMNASEDAIPLNVEGSKLTLSTCNSFGEKSDRFVVTAALVEIDPS